MLLLASGFLPDTWIGEFGYVDAPIPKLYVASFFFALQIMCGAYSGDLHSHVLNTQEQALVCVLLVIGTLIWGYVMGMWVQTLHNISPDLKWYRNTMDSLNTFLSVNEVPYELRCRLREYFQQTQHMHRGIERKKLMKLMCPALVREVSWQLNGKWLERVPFLQGVEQELLVRISVAMEPAIFVPKEVPPLGYFYLIHRGVAVYEGRVLLPGSSWGHDMILTRQDLCDVNAMAMTYLEVYRLSRPALLDVASPFPLAWKKIRWDAIRLALVRILMSLARGQVHESLMLSYPDGTKCGPQDRHGAEQKPELPRSLSSQWSLFMGQPQQTRSSVAASASMPAVPSCPLQASVVENTYPPPISEDVNAKSHNPQSREAHLTPLPPLQRPDSER